MKRWCKRPPASPETGAARQAPPGATPIGAMTRPAELQVGGNEPAGDDRPRWMAAPDRIPLIDRLTESPAMQGFPTEVAARGCRTIAIDIQLPLTPNHGTLRRHMGETGGPDAIAPSATGGLRRRGRSLLVAGTNGSASAATALPTHVYAPYFETWTTDRIATLAQQSGSKYFTLAFLESLNKRSCTLAWNGSSSQTVAAGRYLSDMLRCAPPAATSSCRWAAGAPIRVVPRSPTVRRSHRSPPPTRAPSPPTTFRAWTWTSKDGR